MRMRPRASMVNSFACAGRWIGSEAAIMPSGPRRWRRGAGPQAVRPGSVLHRSSTCGCSLCRADNGGQPRTCPARCLTDWRKVEAMDEPKHIRDLRSL
jgi:hypothetical protein